MERLGSRGMRGMGEGNIKSIVLLVSLLLVGPYLPVTVRGMVTCYQGIL